MFDIYLRKILDRLGVNDRKVDSDMLQAAVQAYRVRLDAATAARVIKAEKAARASASAVVPGA